MDNTELILYLGKDRIYRITKFRKVDVTCSENIHYIAVLKVCAYMLA